MTHKLEGWHTLHVCYCSVTKCHTHYYQTARCHTPYIFTVVKVSTQLPHIIEKLGLILENTTVTICTICCNIKTLAFGPHSIYRSLWFSQETYITSMNSTDRFVCVMLDVLCSLWGRKSTSQSEHVTNILASFQFWPPDSKGKGIVHPTTGHEGPKGEYRYSSILSLTSALDGGRWSTPRPGRFTPGKDTVPTVQEAGCAPGPVWTRAENLAPIGIRSPDRTARSESLYRLSYPNPRPPDSSSTLTFASLDGK